MNYIIIMDRQAVINYAKLLINRGFCIVPTRANDKGLYKVPVWKGSIEQIKQGISYDMFLQKVQNLNTFSFGIILGLQNNTCRVGCIDIDIDILFFSQ